LGWIGSTSPLNLGIDVGDEVDAVTGVLNYSFGVHKVAPPDASDVVGYQAAP